MTIQLRQATPGSAQLIEFQCGDRLAVGVGWMPGRKQPCVVVRRGGTVYTAAYCRSVEEAQRLIDALYELTGNGGDA